METFYIKVDHNWEFRHFEILSDSKYEELTSENVDTLSSTKEYYEKNKNNKLHINHLHLIESHIKTIKEKMKMLLDISSPKYTNEKKQTLITDVIDTQLVPENILIDEEGNYLFRIKVNGDISYLFRTNIENLYNLDINRKDDSTNSDMQYCKENEQDYLKVYPFSDASKYISDTNTKNIDNKTR